VRKNLKVGAQR